MKTISGSKPRYSGGVSRALWLFAIFLCPVLPALSQGRGGGERPLPAGPGKAMVETACAQCHGLNTVTRPVGHTPEEWQKIMDDMVELGTSLTRDQIPVVTDYLVRNFPDRSIKAVAIPGPVEVSIRGVDCTHTRLSAS